MSTPLIPTSAISYSLYNTRNNVPAIVGGADFTTGKFTHSFRGGYEKFHNLLNGGYRRAYLHLQPCHRRRRKHQPWRMVLIISTPVPTSLLLRALTSLTNSSAMTEPGRAEHTPSSSAPASIASSAAASRLSLDHRFTPSSVREAASTAAITRLLTRLKVSFWATATASSQRSRASG